MCSEAARLAFALLALLAAAPGQGKVFLSADEALKLAFPAGEVTRLRVALDRDQERRVAELTDAPCERAMVVAYEARKAGELIGTAYFDAHRVRTHKQVLMVVVTPDAKVARLEVLAFGEPLEYLPRANFYAQFVGRELDAELRAKGGIKVVTGATLATAATIDAVRRVLAVHTVRGGVPPAPVPEPKPEPKPDSKPEPAPAPPEARKQP